MFFQCDLNHQIVFGNGTLDQLPELIHGMGRNVFLTTGRSAKQRGLLSHLMELLTDFQVLHFDQISPNPKAEEVHQAVNLLEQEGFEPDFVLAVGGGSVLDFAKAVAASFASGTSVENVFGINNVPAALPLVAVPTTHGTGSEVTKYSIITHENQKKSISDAKIVPELALVDPVLTYSMPEDVAIDTTLDAFSHLSEAYFSALCNPLVEAFAEKGFSYLAPHMKNLGRIPMAEKVHDELTLASLFGGLAINNAGSGVVHAMGYPLTSEFELPHGRANAVLMPGVFKFNAEVKPEKYQKMSEMLGVSDLADYLCSINEQCGFVEQIKGVASQVDESKLLNWAEQVVNNHRLMNSACRKPSLEQVVELYKEALFMTA